RHRRAPGGCQGHGHPREGEKVRMNASHAQSRVACWLMRSSTNGPSSGQQKRRFNMKIVVFGGSGLIGKKLIPILRGWGHEAVSASPSSGVNTITGEGLAKALAGADVVVDVTNAPSWEDKAVLEFFETSTRNVLAAEAAAGVNHHVALSVVGADRMTDSGYMRAKVAQEKLIKASGAPYTILRATQFFEFLSAIAGPGADTARVADAPMQPLAADDVAAALADVAVGSPANGMLE